MSSRALSVIKVLLYVTYLLLWHWHALSKPAFIVITIIVTIVVISDQSQLVQYMKGQR